MLKRTLLTLTLFLLSTSMPAAEVADLGWMSGHWYSTQESGWGEEHWLAPRDGLMLGLNRSAGKSGKVNFEFMRIQADPDGVPVYWAAPGGGTPVPFRLDGQERNQASFINPEHDYPQRISYLRDGDRLQATIANLDGSSPIVFQWRMQPSDPD